MSKNKYRPYPKYKPSGIDWLGDIPEWWELLKVKHLFKISEEASFEANPTILSLTQHGIKKRDISNNEGQIASSYSGYRKISIGDVVLNIMDLLSGFVDRSQYNGVISPAYATLKPTKKIETKYFNYFFQKHYFEKIFFPFGQGVSVDHRWTLKDFTLLNFPIIKPTFEEQEKIAKFLDNKLEKIDQIIEKNNHLVELLHEKRQAVITRAVTKGLDPRARLKPSGIDWLGDIPENWEVKRLNYLISNIVDKATNSQKSDFIVALENIEGWTGNFLLPDDQKMPEGDLKRFSKGDVLFGKLRPYLAKVFLAEQNGLCVGEALVFRTKRKLLNKFLAYRILTKDFINYIDSSTQGAKMPRAEWEFIKTLFISYPSSEEQQKIIKYIDHKTAKIDEIVKKVKTENQKLQEYRQALISNAVTGKIQV